MFALDWYRCIAAKFKLCSERRWPRTVVTSWSLWCQHGSAFLLGDALFPAHCCVNANELANVGAEGAPVLSGNFAGGFFLLKINTNIDDFLFAGHGETSNECSKCMTL